MKHIALILLATIFLISCKSARSARIITKKSKTETKSTEPSLASTVVNNAIAFEGAGYKYGGTTKKGMDCSGLIYTVFREEDILLPRISRDMAKSGSKINLNQVEKGDLIFFKTSKSRNVINHVGLVTSTAGGNIKFIHATSSKGVLTSSLSEHYWKSTFVEARRIL